MLEKLTLFGNNIGNAGCNAIATLLADPNCNFEHLYLARNAITAEGATTIANSLTNNNKLHTLYLYDNHMIKLLKSYSTIITVRPTIR